MNRKIEIIPAILPKDFFELEEKANLVRSFVKRIQIDVCDGQFTSTPSWPYKKHDDNFEKIVSQEEGLPGWQDVGFEIDMMVSQPDQIIDEWISAGVDRIVLHVESGIKGKDAVNDKAVLLQNNPIISKTIKDIAGRVDIGLALNINTPIEVLNNYKDDIQFVQCMGIDNVGYQGQSFNPAVIDKIAKIKSIYPNLMISVDGGVSLDNARDLVDAGADRLVVGSAIFDSDNFADAIHNFKTLL
jgi:ribulose-phosphate 3-epimerase